eukprot:CAMPEP_0197236122 /NCGR_PEP_ID=MMETSP1429-20130617/3359_1 /TAXON_ID=49237 /ORGANISM="Chaetoceros  sp., Strain UNC1202" /LENGTH=149 /DNA_ID=CAMNT_0042694867 /DNA_START=96 /DNA_END=545 /DNA_ORIENTATION=+
MSTSKQSAFSKLSQDRQDDQNATKPRSMTIASRAVLFFIFPLIVGSVGLIASHIQFKYGKDPRPMNFDRDFIFPFLMTLVLVVVVSIQTGNFSSYKANPLVSWPKVVKKRKIIRRTVVVDDDGNVIEDEDVLRHYQSDHQSGESDKKED